jgi:hypothetical protein
MASFNSQVTFIRSYGAFSPVSDENLDGEVPHFGTK